MFLLYNSSFLDVIIPGFGAACKNCLETVRIDYVFCLFVCVDLPGSGQSVDGECVHYQLLDVCIRCIFYILRREDDHFKELASATYVSLLKVPSGQSGSA
jgi:hypothetical protein